MAENLRGQTSAEQEATHADLLRGMVMDTPTKGIAPTHPSYTAANDVHTVFLESLVDDVPDQATPYYGSA